MIDEIEEGIRAAAVRVLRRRAQRQRDRAASWTIIRERRAHRGGRGAHSERIAAALDQAADELERGRGGDR